MAKVTVRYRPTTFKIFAADHEVGSLDREDPRQATAAAVIRGLAQQQQEEGWETATANLEHGIPASRVPLGWIQDKLQSYIDAAEPDRLTLREGIYGELPFVIQRLKRLHLWWYTWTLVLSFSTKDDHGYYDYEISVRARHLKDTPIEPECVRDNVLYMNHIASTLKYKSEHFDAEPGLQKQSEHIQATIEQLMKTHVDPYE